jgi:hypothetical protein
MRPRARKPVKIAGWGGLNGQKPAKTGELSRKPKKTVENQHFSIDFAHLKAAL